MSCHNFFGCWSNIHTGVGVSGFSGRGFDDTDNLPINFSSPFTSSCFMSRNISWEILFYLSPVHNGVRRNCT